MKDRLKIVKQAFNQLKRVKGITDEMIEKALGGKTLEQHARNINTVTKFLKNVERMKEQPKLKEQVKKIDEKSKARGRKNMLKNIEKEVKKDIKSDSIPKLIDNMAKYNKGNDYTAKDIMDMVEKRWNRIESDIETLTGKPLSKDNKKLLNDIFKHSGYNISALDTVLMKIREVYMMYKSEFDQAKDDVSDNMAEQMLERASRSITSYGIDVPSNNSYKNIKDIANHIERGNIKNGKMFK